MNFFYRLHIDIFLYRNILIKQKTKCKDMQNTKLTNTLLANEFYKEIFEMEYQL